MSQSRFFVTTDSGIKTEVNRSTREEAITYARALADMSKQRLVLHEQRGFYAEEIFDSAADSGPHIDFGEAWRNRTVDAHGIGHFPVIPTTPRQEASAPDADPLARRISLLRSAD